MTKKKKSRGGKDYSGEQVRVICQKRLKYSVIMVMKDNSNMFGNEFEKKKYLFAELHFGTDFEDRHFGTMISFINLKDALFEYKQRIFMEEL